MRIIRRRLPDGILGQTDGNTIIVDDRLSAAQMFVTVQHELVHQEMGHTRHQPEHIEADVRYETARRCLAVETLAGACGGDPEQGARVLGVTRKVLMDRAATLTDAEAARVGCPSCRACPAMKHRFAPAEFTLGA
jgi:hypothetical protein